MKVNPWIFPALTTLVIGGWITAQKKSAATLEREIAVITERIGQLKNTSEPPCGTAENHATEKDKKIHWKTLAGKMGDMQSGRMPDVRTMMRTHQILMEMSAAELCSQLDEISGMGLEDAARKQLEGMIISALAQKDPKLVLTRFSDAMGDENSSGHWQLSMALSEWADTEPAAASAWLDAQIAAGKFVSKSLDGKNQALVRFEGALVNALLKTDPAAATARVLAMPETQRKDFFQQGSFHDLPEKNEAAYAKLVRDTMPVEKVGVILANAVSMLAMQDGYERIDGFITSTKATEGEKKSIVERMIQNTLNQHNEIKINVESLDKVRKWANTQSPSVVDKATGEALASTLWKDGVTFEKTSELVLQYHEKADNDEVLVSFLKNSSVMYGKNKGDAKLLIDKIKDPTLQEEIRNLPDYKN